jgi:hypothetical protein
MIYDIYIYRLYIYYLGYVHEFLGTIIFIRDDSSSDGFIDLLSSLEPPLSIPLKDRFANYNIDDENDN